VTFAGNFLHDNALSSQTPCIRVAPSMGFETRGSDRNMSCWLLHVAEGYRSISCSDYRVLSPDAVKSDRYMPTFWINLLPQSSRWRKSDAGK
jgi:hypothetical protein